MLISFLIFNILLSITIYKIIKYKAYLTIPLFIAENGYKYKMSSLVNITTSVDRIAVDVHDADLLCTIDGDYIIRYKTI